MRVAILGQYPRDKGRIVGGTSAVAWRLADALSKQQEVEVHAVVPAPGLAAPFYQRCNLVHEHYFPSVETLGRLTFYRIDRIRAGRVFKEIRPDVIHVHTAIHYPPMVWHSQWPWVLTPHGMIVKEAKLRHGLRARFGAVLSSWQEKLAYRATQDIIVISDYVIPFVQPFTKAQLHPIPNPIADTYFNLPNREVPGMLLFVGWLMPRKGVACLFQAMNELRRRGCECRLHLVGQSQDPNYVNELRAYMDQNKLQDYIMWLGTVEEEYLLQLYSQCSVFVLSSLEETLPVAIGQAMAARKPVVATRSAGIPFMVKDGQTGYLAEYGDSIGFADGIEAILNDSSLRRAMGNAARKEAEAKYSSESVAKKHLEVYEQAIRKWKGVT